MLITVSPESLNRARARIPGVVVRQLVNDEGPPMQIQLDNLQASVDEVQESLADLAQRIRDIAPRGRR